MEAKKGTFMITKLDVINCVVLLIDHCEEILADTHPTGHEYRESLEIDGICALCAWIHQDNVDLRVEIQEILHFLKDIVKRTEAMDDEIVMILIQQHLNKRLSEKSPTVNVINQLPD